MAFMGSAQFQKDKFGILLDAVYAKLSTDGTWLQERVSTETETKLGFYTAALSYRFYDDPKGYVDVYGGARYFDTTIEFKLGTANLGQRSFSESLDWTDAIIGFRGGVTLNDRWSLHGFADYGGFDGSNDTELGSLRRRQLRLQRPLGRHARLPLRLDPEEGHRPRQPRHRHPGPALRRQLPVLRRR